jgi:3-oxoacyl-[acyl-carrier-protein] synthase-1
MLLIALTGETSRPGVAQHHAHEALDAARPHFQTSMSPQSLVLRAGRAGLSAVLDKAHELLSRGAVRQVMVLGADSFLLETTIDHYLDAERLLVSGNRDGFIPAEAAAAVLLELAQPDTPGLHIMGWGQGDEPGRPDGSVPSRATGLSTALRAAFDRADITCNDLAFRLSDQNGEGFFANEAANAFVRVGLEGGTTPMVHTTADCTGEIGAATGPLMLAWLHHLLSHPDRPGECGVIHLANDEGLRSAVVVEFIDPATDISTAATSHASS